MERFSFVFLVAGLGFFLLAFAVSAYIPMLPVAGMEVKTVEELASQPPLDFIELAEQYPDAFEKAFGEHKNGDDYDMPAAFAEALRIGHKSYIGEGCWHCHSQQIRPWGNDEARYGQVSFPEEYHHELGMPPLWGTRRIGPDLVRKGGNQSNDWHVAHFYKPQDVNPASIMPGYPWFYEDDDPATDVNESLQPNKTGLSIIAYVQWLGTWTLDSDENIYDQPKINRENPVPTIVRPPVEESDAAEPVKKSPVEEESDEPVEETEEDEGYGDDESDEYGDESTEDEEDY